MKYPNRQRLYIPFGYSRVAAATACMADFAGITEVNPGAELGYHIWPADEAGAVVGVRITTSVATMGSTVITVHKADNGTIPSSGSAAATDTVNVAAASTNYFFDMAGGTFTKGQNLGVEVNPTGNHGDVHGVLIVDVDVSAG